MNIPLAKPEILESDIEAVVAVLRSSRLSQGPALRAFEKGLAAYVNIDHAIALNSGTSALQLALQSLQIGEGDEVILPSFSFMAVTNAVLATRATPVYADIDPSTLNLEPTKVESLLTPQTRAIIVVDTFGRVAEVEQIRAIAHCYGLFVIEDACEAIGAEVNGRKAGTLGDLGVFAFYPNKQITTGEGGALVTNSAMLAQVVRGLCNQGRQNSAQWFQHVDAGYSYRLSDVNCALGLKQLSRIEDILRTRECIAQRYREQLDANNHGARCCFELPTGRISWFTFPILLPEDMGQRERDEIWQQLKEIGIECGRYFPPAHLQPVMRKFPFRCGDLRATVEVSQRLLCLPLFNSLEQAEIEFICEALDKVLGRRKIGNLQLAVGS